MNKFWLVYQDGYGVGGRCNTREEATKTANAAAEDEPDINAFVMEAVENWVVPKLPASNEGFDV